MIDGTDTGVDRRPSMRPVGAPRFGSTASEKLAWPSAFKRASAQAGPGLQSAVSGLKWVLPSLTCRRPSAVACLCEPCVEMGWRPELVIGVIPRSLDRDLRTLRVRVQRGWIDDSHPSNMWSGPGTASACARRSRRETAAEARRGDMYRWSSDAVQQEGHWRRSVPRLLPMLTERGKSRLLQDGQ